MEMNEIHIKKEKIESGKTFVCIIEVKQELDEEEHKVNAGNVSSVIPIKQEVNVDSNSDLKFQECASIKRESISNDINPHIKNKIKYLKMKRRRRIKSRGRFLFEKYIKKQRSTNGITVCTLCGTLYTKQEEFDYHSSTSHYLKQKKLWKTKFKTKRISNIKKKMIDTTIFAVLKNKDGRKIVKGELKEKSRNRSHQFNVVGPCSDQTVISDNICYLKKNLRCQIVEKPFKCDICSIFLSRIDLLNIHLRCHAGEKPFKCDSCLKSFSRKNSLNRHMRCHSSEKPFQCDICFKYFSQKGHLNIHLRWHAGEKPFKCDICLKSFSHKGNLNTHYRSHTGEKPFKCDICFKSFSHRGYLNTHLRFHTGDKPFKCDICLKSFVQKSYLKTHLRRHTGKNPFQCAICLKTFLHNGHLNTHMRRHTGEKPFKCATCLKSFVLKGDLNRHLRCHREKPS